jgi:hypothetical protein
MANKDEKVAFKFYIFINMNLKVASEYYVDGSTLKKELDGAP